MASVEGLFSYPVKSMAGIDSSTLGIGARGPNGDRRWMVVDDDGRFVTGRTVPALSRCTVVAEPTGIRLTFGAESLQVPTPGGSAQRQAVVVWRDTCDASDAGEMAADWLTRIFGKPLRLVYQTDTDHRRLPAGKAHRKGDEVSFADGYPLLLTGTASLEDLNARLDAAVTMTHFRPNIVAATDMAFIEDGWQRIAIGDVEFIVASRCSRCIFTTVDPATGTRRQDGEPLRTLRAYRRDKNSGQIMFGVNLIPLSSGTVDAGSEIRVLA